MSEDVLDVPGACALLGLSRNTVYDLCARGKIPHQKAGRQIRFSRAAIMRWLDSCSVQPSPEGQ